MDRPKRTIGSRCLEYNGGMLHEEELALRRALQASLLASLVKGKRSSNKSTKDKQPSVKNDEDAERNGRRSSRVKTLEKSKTDNNNNNKRKSEDSKPVKRAKRLLVQVSPARKNNEKMDVVKKQRRANGSSSKDLKKKDLKEKVIKRRRRKQAVASSEVDSPSKSGESTPLVVRAQRKFAQSNPTSPRSSLLYQKQPLKTRAKTEDFLDFLCLRGTERMPKSLELFNNPCAPVSPLTDDEEDLTTKTSSPTIASIIKPPFDNTQTPSGEPTAKRSLILRNIDEPCSSSSSPFSTVSPPISTIVQPHTVLPQFTSAKNNYGVLTHIPTPIPCQRPHGVDVYGLPHSGLPPPPGFPHHPSVSSVAMETHKSPSSCSPSEKQGFYVVNSSSPFSGSDGDFAMANHSNMPSNVASTSSTLAQGKAGETTSESPNCQSKGRNNRTPNKIANKSPNKKPQESPGKIANKSPKAKKGSAKTSEHVDSCVPQGMNGVSLFTPTEQEFMNPLRYIESIREKAEEFGMCVIVPPESWKPDFCLADDVRFTTKFQHIHRFGNSYPNVEIELAAIRRHLEQQDISLAIMPQIAGCELDLPHMSKVVREFGGLQQIIDKRKWGKVADTLKIPKTAVERTGKLEQIYCKYLLAYDLLSEQERTKLVESVQSDLNFSDSSQECISKGRSMALSLFQRTSRNNVEHHLRSNADVNDVEQTYWQVVDEGDRYVVVHDAQLPSTAFPTGKGTPFSKSKWNLNVLPKILGSILRDVDDIEGISSPLVKVNMMFSTDTWKTSPMALYTLEYLHQGAEKIVYSIPSTNKQKFTDVLSAKYEGRNLKDLMASPLSLINAGVSVYKVVQQPGQFVLKFPRAYHSSIASGYSVCELVSFAPLSHIQQIKASFQGSAMQPTCLGGSGSLFSWEDLVVASVKGELRRNTNVITLNILITELEELRSREAMLRSELKERGVDIKPSVDDEQEDKETDETSTCQVCDRSCFLSVVLDSSEKSLCLEHALSNLREENNKNNAMILVSHIELTELDELLQKAKKKMDDLQCKPKVTRRRSSIGSTLDN